MSAAVNKIEPSVLRGMTDEGIAAEIFALLRKVVPHEIREVRLDWELVGDIGIDSLGTYELVMDAEDRFGVEIADEQLLELKTIRDLVNLVRTRLE